MPSDPTDSSTRPAPAAPETQHMYCQMPQLPEPQFDLIHDLSRLSAIAMTRKKWQNGTNIKYYFFDDADVSKYVLADGSTTIVSWRASDGAQLDRVRQAFDEWKAQRVGLVFTEVDDRSEAELRIGFEPGRGSWSYVGTDNLRIGMNARTMNFGWDLTGPSGGDTALHEIGHAIGFPHEHQNPYAGIVWNEDFVYAALSRPPNKWDRETIFRNVLMKLDISEVEGSSWDPDSVMHYPFSAGFILEPESLRNGLTPAPGLSARDAEWARRFYPPLDGEAVDELVLGGVGTLDIGSGEQKDFVVRPRATRTYTFQVLGEGDTTMVLVRIVDGEPLYVAGDNDMGFDRQARLRVRLYRGDEYRLRVRVACRLETEPLLVAMF